MSYAKRLRQTTVTLAMTLVLMMAITGCGKEETLTPEPAPAATEDGQAQNGSSEQEGNAAANEPAVSDEGNPNEDAGKATDEAQSLEQASAKDGGKFLEALKQQDTQSLSSLMTPAENEYTVADMEKVLEGFQMYFDRLEELQLRFESSEQSDERYIEHYAITGAKDGKARELPFQVSYVKTQGMNAIQDDARREPLFDSPLIGRYPYAELEVGRYVQALQAEDKASIPLHLGLYEENDETKATAERLLRKYADSFDLKTTKVVSKGYDEHKDQFQFELRDDDGHTHVLWVVGGELRIADDWSTDQGAS
ncbi:hypothetical protein ACFFSY_17245 [Paenibacillus aurantiacus]|uniref:Uncharacterized protein n=1 Tax=Paenibacillus aurantiacus TaxID=1936118 RepID=A0ABV5KR12_9BACL